MKHNFKIIPLLKPQNIWLFTIKHLLELAILKGEKKFLSKLLLWFPKSTQNLEIIQKGVSFSAT